MTGKPETIDSSVGLVPRNALVLSGLAKLPEKRGVYMFKDAVGQVIYVGRVRSLRNRDKNRKTPGDFSC
jgi:excinuclease UvrABC nuclease subunit